MIHRSMGAMEKFSASAEFTDPRDDVWVVTFSILFGKRRDRSIVCAKNLSTGEELCTPQDFSRLCELVPFDDWPPFAKNMRDRLVCASDEKSERLF